MRGRFSLFWFFTVIQIWVAHAAGFFAHEYAHSFTAWLLHCKADPFALNYGHLGLDNILWQSNIDENVDYAPIFADGRGPSAALIAIAGVLIGNGISYLASRWLYAETRQKKAHAWAGFFFWLCLMSVGNFYCYVPIRTFTTRYDMATTARGLYISPWAIALVLGAPFALALWHFFAKILPDAQAFLLPEALLSQRVFVVIVTFFVFMFFGGSGMHGYGNVSHWLSVVSVCILFPVVTVICWLRLPKDVSGGPVLQVRGSGLG
jgi:hypothetical protein